MLVLSPSVPCTLTVPANPVEYIAAVCSASLLLMCGWASTTELISSKNVTTYLLSTGPGKADPDSSITPDGPNWSSAYVSVFVSSEILLRYTT